MHSAACKSSTFDLVPSARSPPHSLFEAALLGNILFISEMLRLCVGTDIKLIDVCTRSEGFSLMHYAVAGNQQETVSFLLRKMTRPHTPDSSGVSPFALAARYGHSKILKLLLAAGALVPGVDRLGNTCLHEAAGMGQNASLKYLLELVTNDRNAALVCYVLWLKNLKGMTCYDHALHKGYPETAELILGYMRKHCCGPC